MCGITGLFDTRGRREFPQPLLARMNASQHHRGPDEGGEFLAPGVALGHRRLSIIDLSSGQQPMRSADGQVTLVYNGEIYNFPELMDELKALGSVFHTRCDTEVILHAWQRWGPACVERFRGMFAFALFDANSQSLFLARDRFGVKPLFYSLLPDGALVFASELKTLREHPDLPRRLHAPAIEDYFALGYIPEPATIYQGVYKLPPGHTLWLREGQPPSEPEAYWDLRFTGTAQLNELEAEEELRRRLFDAVKIRMVSEVPLGAFLSGGVDSSAVVAAMAQAQSDPVNTCAIGFDVPDYDETHYARLVAERYQTNHFERIVSSEDFDLLDTLAGIYDEPYADSSALPTYRVCQLARERVTVALSGDGGDEHFAGYRRYRMHLQEERVRSRLPLGLRRAVFGTLGSLYPKADWAPRVLRAKSTFQSLARDSVGAYLHGVSIARADQRALLFSPALKRALQGYQVREVFDRHAAAANTDDPLALIQYLDVKTYLVGDILTKVDRASMAHSLEVREPLLDHPMLEWAASLPSHYKLRGQEGKYLLKKAMEPLLPHDVLYRRKMGFGVPLARWFRGPLRARVRASIIEGGLAKSDLFEQSYLEKVVAEHESQRRDHSALLWTLLMFEATTRADGFAL